MTTPSRSSYRILIVEDHVLFAESLELALSMDGYDVRRMPVPDGSSSPSAVVSAVLRIKPRVVLLDLDLGSFGDGARLIAPIVRAGTQVVVVTATADRGRWGECLRSGARNVVSKARPLNDIRAVVRRLHQGLPVMDRAEREELLQAFHRQQIEVRELRDRLERLTARERVVLGELMAGRTVRDIAAASVVSEATVRTQVKSILAKLEVTSQLAAVGLAHHVGWQPPAA